MAEKVALKLSHAGETHRVTVALRSDAAQLGDVLTYELVLSKVRELFPRLGASSNWTLVYRDDEGDVVTLSHALEFAEACRVQLEGQPLDRSPLPSLHFCVLARVSLRDKVAAPVLQTVTELARLAARLAGGAVTQAGHALEHLRHSELLSRGRESVGHTRMLLLSARSGVSTRLRRASSAVAAGIERRRSSSGSSDSRFDPAEVVKSQAPSSPSTEVTMTVDLRQSIASATSEVMEPTDREVMPALMPADGLEQSEQETVYESDADTLCDDEEDREWDVVDHAGAGGEAIAEQDEEWAAQLDVIRGILVHVDEEQCCDLLAQHKGDVAAVLVELTNM